jgi:hypothetical protein
MNMETRNSNSYRAQLSRTLAALFLLSVLAPAPGFAQEQSDQNQSLVKAAREKSAHKSKVVITDDDMPSHPEPPAETAPGSSASSQTEKQDDAAQKGDEQNAKTPKQVSAPKDLTLEQAQALVDRLKEQEKSLIRQYDELQEKLNGTTDALLRDVYSNMLSKRDEVLSNKRKEIDQAEKGLQMAQARQSQGETTDAAK